VAVVGAQAPACARAGAGASQNAVRAPCGRGGDVVARACPCRCRSQVERAQGRLWRERRRGGGPPRLARRKVASLHLLEGWGVFLPTDGRQEEPWRRGGRVVSALSTAKGAHRPLGGGPAMRARRILWRRIEPGVLSSGFQMSN